MYCPYCRHPDSRVVDSREADEGAAEISIGDTEKVVRGVARACQGRAVDNDALNLLAQQVEDAIRAKGSPEVPSHEVGLAILGPLRDLDEVAYLRFASVYRSFSSAEDFEREIEELREHQERRAIDPAAG